jgi:hypothetical protein
MMAPGSCLGSVPARNGTHPTYPNVTLAQREKARRGEAWNVPRASEFILIGPAER